MELLGRLLSLVSRWLSLRNFGKNCKQGWTGTRIQPKWRSLSCKLKHCFSCWKEQDVCHVCIMRALRAVPHPAQNLQARLGYRTRPIHLLSKKKKALALDCFFFITATSGQLGQRSPQTTTLIKKNLKDEKLKAKELFQSQSQRVNPKEQSLPICNLAPGFQLRYLASPKPASLLHAWNSMPQEPHQISPNHSRFYTMQKSLQTSQAPHGTLVCKLMPQNWQLRTGMGGSSNACACRMSERQKGFMFIQWTSNRKKQKARA